jgi:hypothetical protein
MMPRHKIPEIARECHREIHEKTQLGGLWWSSIHYFQPKPFHTSSLRENWKETS